MGVVLWIGDPDCQAAHVAILAKLAEISPYFVESPPSDEPTLNILKGNLGEFIAFCVAHWHEFAAYGVFAANAMTPLSSISKPEIDLVWLRFGPTSQDDVAILQEVKTTGGVSLNYADRLLNDYDKLFGTDPRFTLHTRFQAIKNRLEYEQGNRDMCSRVNDLAGQSPQTSPKTGLLPTLLHNIPSADAKTKMVTIRSALIGRMWPAPSVKAWAIGLSELNERLSRLAAGKE